MKRAFVTGATGLLGNNLVRALVAEGVEVRGLVRDVEKGRLQFGELPGLELVRGDMLEVEAFADALDGVDVLFHTAAYFRDSFKGGTHWEMLERVNVDGTRTLLEAARARGVHRVIHASSIAVLDGARGELIDESMERALEGAADYFRSKILSDRVVFEHLEAHPEMNISLVLPGWMHGPGDRGPTSGGQFTLDVLRGALPGVPPATFAFVDARDVAAAMIAAVDKGRRGERYLAAGRHLEVRELLAEIEQVTGATAPRRGLPVPLLWTVAGLNELYARLTGREVLLSMASVRNLREEYDKSHFDHSRSERELGISFRPVAETLRDEVAWFRAEGMLESAGD